MSMQDDFERAYAEDNGGLPVEFIKLARQGDSYNIPKIARAWYWWKRSRASLVIELPECFDKRDVQGLDYAETVAAIEVHGLKVTP